MRRLLLIAASVTPLIFAASTEALAQRQFGGHGFRAGGFHGGGGWRGGAAWRGGGAWRGGPAFRGGYGWRGAYPGAGYWRGGGYGWRGYYAPRYRYGGYPYWGWGAGLATLGAVGALATYPAYPDYYPAYPVYPAYDVAPAASGGQCSTPVKVCTLYEPAPIGTGCSCRVTGGRARGTVVGP